jgi:hypothetical protein
MFSNEFAINYEHFDAKDLNNKKQVSIYAKCKDIGLNFVQNKKKIELTIEKDSDYEESQSSSSEIEENNEQVIDKIITK